MRSHLNNVTPYGLNIYYMSLWGPFLLKPWQEAQGDTAKSSGDSITVAMNERANFPKKKLAYCWPGLALGVGAGYPLSTQRFCMICWWKSTPGYPSSNYGWLQKAAEGGIDCHDSKLVGYKRTWKWSLVDLDPQSGYQEWGRLFLTDMWSDALRKI